MTFQVGDRVEVVGYDQPTVKQWDGVCGTVTMIGTGGKTIYMNTDSGKAAGFRPEHLRLVPPFRVDSARSMLDEALDRPAPKKKERVPDEIDWDKYDQFMRDL